MSSHLDERLLERIRLRDRQALELLYTRYEPLLYRYAYRLTNNAEQAESALTELFCQVWTLTDSPLKRLKTVRASLMATLEHIIHQRDPETVGTSTSKIPSA